MIIKPVPEGRETDRDIALLLGWEQCACGNMKCDFWVTPDRSSYDADLPHYSTFDTAALGILPVMRARGLFCKITYFWTEEYGVHASFDDQGVSDPNPPYQGMGDTIAEAICRAALAWAKGETVA